MKKLLIETHSQTWHFVRQWAEDQIADAKEQLYALPGGEDRQRGRIDALNALLGLAADNRPVALPRDVGPNAV